MMSNTKNILLDLGAVLLNIDVNKLKPAFESLGVKDFNLIQQQLTEANLFDDLETGKISPDAFCETIRTASDLPLKDADIMAAWNALLLDFREDTMHFLIQLRKNYKLYLLSNTNAIHLEQFYKQLYQQLGNTTLDFYFDKLFYSHLIGMRKPDAAIYDFVLKDAGISAAETLFIDDLELNTNAAAALGFQIHQLQDHERVEKLPYFLL
jgi:HAD superfamily hydrolase (TIGR01509 family)